MEVGWRDLLVLLRGDTNVHTICEAIVENLEGNVAALPDICHDVVLGLLSSESPTVRANASQLLMHIAERFSALLQPLISESRNDGDFINIFDIDVGFIAAKEESLLFNRRADASIALDDGSLYKKSWLDRQRRELLKRIKAETASTDFRAATSYTDMDTCIREADVAPSKSGGPGAAVLLPAAPVSLHVSGQDPTEETWLARLVRYLIVGLLSPQWEMRHGCALGLTQLVRGLFPHLEAEQHASAQPPRPQLLPSFLVDDILCCGICVLILDRYMDFGSENAFVLSPVKEAVGELLACALRCDVQPQKVKRVWELLQTMALSKQHWTVPLGGMVALKHFAAANTGLMLGHFGQFLGCLGAALCEDCAGREELVLAACEVIRAFAVPVRADLLGQVVLVQVLDGLSMLADMLISVVALVASDDRHWSPRSVQGLAAALSSVGALVLAMAAASASVSASEPVSAVCERALQCCSLVLRGFCALLAVGPRYRPATKLTCCELLGAALGAAFETASAHAPGQASLIATCSTSTVDEFSSTLFSLLGTLLATCVLSTDRPVSDLTLTMEAPPAKGKAAVAVAERGAASFCATWDPPVELFTSQQLWTRVARAFRRTSLLSFACSSCAPGGEVDVQHQLLLASVLQRVVTSGTDPDSEPPHGQTQAWVEGLLGRVSSPMSALRNAAFAGHVVAMEQHCVHLHDVARLSPLSPVDPAKSAEPAEKGKASNSIWMNYRPQGLDPLRFIVSELLRADAPDCDVSLLPPRGDGGASPHTEICSAFAEGLGAVADEFARRLQACDEQLLRKEKRRRDKGAPLAKRSRFSFVLVPDVCEEPQHQDAPESMHPIPPLAQGGMSEAKRRLQEQRDMLAGAVEGALLLAAEVANASLTHSARGALRDCARNACTPTHPANARMHFAAYYLQSALDRQVGDALSLARSPGIDLCLHPTHIARSLAHLFLEGEEGGSLWAVLLELCSVGGRGGFAVAQSTVYLLVKVLQQEFLQRFPAFFPALTLDMRARDRGTLGSTMSDSPAALLLHCALCGANAALLRRLVVEQGIVAAVVDAVGAGEMPADPARQLRGASIAAASCARLFAPCGRAGEGAGEAAGEGAGAGAGEGVASAFQYLVAQQIAERLHGVITQAPVAHPYLQDEDGGSAREGAAELLRLLAIHTRGVVLCCYELWFVSALHGVGDPSGAVRGACVHVFRLLVPLAGLAQQTRQRRTALTQREQGQGQESGVAPPSAADLVEQVFTQQPLPRISQSASPQDAQIMAQLARLTNLVEKGDGGQVEGLAGSQLRGYQWDGVSWLTHLRRLGLCGVLADEM
ncbi:hypothetical protein B484DRAFT_398622 [Ochromonadaceae sp. CCMP2298]|nr:hypothetical protein B484DRAFT_398622 [Ochromonadaceae sp. CCMP2298]